MPHVLMTAVYYVEMQVPRNLRSLGLSTTVVKVSSTIFPAAALKTKWVSFPLKEVQKTRTEDGARFIISGE
jgi:hypothetical protein